MTSNRARSFSWRSLLSTRFTIILACLGLIIGVTAAFSLDQKQIFLPGETSVGHHLIETSCNSCHEGFKPVSNETCNRCHEAELAQDIHGAKKFKDPRWAGEVEKLAVLTLSLIHI